MVGEDDYTCEEISNEKFCECEHTQTTPACTFESWQTENSCQFSCDPDFPENTQKFMNHIEPSKLFGLFNSFSQISLRKNKRYCLFSYSSVRKILIDFCQQNTRFEWAANQFGQIFYKANPSKKCWSVGSDNQITGQACDQSDLNQRFFFRNDEIRQKKEDGREFCAVVPTQLGCTVLGCGALKMVACFGTGIRTSGDLVKFGSFPENIHENCDLPKVTFRNKSVLDKLKLITKPIFDSTKSKRCMFQKHSSSLKLYFGRCTNSKSLSFSYYSKDDQMLSFKWKSKKLCLGAALSEGLKSKGFVSFKTCDTDDFSQKWIFGGDDDTFIRWQMDESLCVGANDLNSYPNAVLVPCDSSVNSVGSFNEYTPFTPVSFDF